MCKEELSEPLLAAAQKQTYSSKHYYGLACNTTATLIMGAVSLLVPLAVQNIPSAASVMVIHQTCVYLVYCRARSYIQ